MCAWTSPEIDQQSAVGLPVVARNSETSRNQQETRLGLPSHSNWVVTKQKWDFERESCADYLEISGNHVCLDQPRN